MVVSFKVSKVGRRYRPNYKETGNEDGSQESVGDNDEGILEESSNSKDMDKSVPEQVPEDLEVSFSLNLFQNGFCVGKPKELFNDVPMKLLPYDRASEAIFMAIEYGCLPGDIFDQIPCKYSNGAVLCEIQDYRNCFQTGGTATTSPIIHRVLLKMCVENVVKDISSLINECWGYEAFLEVESRILKALQPELQLNPKLQLNRSGRALPCKKVNLGIYWDRRKRKSNDTPECNLQHSIRKQNIEGTEVSGVANQGGQVQVSQDNISRSVPSFQVDRGLENIQSNALALKHNYKLPYGCQTSGIADLSSSPADSGNRGRESFPLAPYERSRYEALPIEGPAIKKLKQGPAKLSLHQPRGAEAKTLALPSNKDLLCQQTETGMSSYQRGPFLLKNISEQELPQRNPKLYPQMSFSIVKQEPAETTNLLNLNVQKMKDKVLTVNTTSCQSDIQMKQSLNSLLSNKAYEIPANAVGKRTTQKRKGLLTTQVTSGGKNASSNFFNCNSLVTEASLPLKQQNNISTVSSVKMTDSLANTKNLHTVDVRYTLGNPQQHLTSIAERNLYLQRLMKLGLVTKRYKLNDRKHKSDPCVQRKNFLWTPLVSSYLPKSDDNDRTRRITSSQELNISNTRSLTFVPQSCARQRNDNSQFDSGKLIQLVISEMMDEEKVEATIAYGVEESDYYTTMTFPSIGSAEQYVAQFKSLMAKEGYCTPEDPIGPIAANSFGNKLSIPYQTFDGSNSSSLPMIDRKLTLDTRLSSPRSHFLPYVDFQPPVQLLPRHISDFQSDNAEQNAPTYEQQSEILVKHVTQQAQIMERKRLQELVMQKLRVEQSGASATMEGLGMIQLGGSGTIQVLGNTGIRYADALQVGNFDTVNTGISQVGNIGQLNNPGTNISNWNPQNQQFGVNVRQSSSFPARLGLSPGQEEAALNGVSTENRGPTSADMGYQLSSQELAHRQRYWQMQGPFLQQQQGMMALLESAEAAELVHLPLSQINLQQFDQLP